MELVHARSTAEALHAEVIHLRRKMPTPLRGEPGGSLERTCRGSHYDKANPRLFDVTGSTSRFKYVRGKERARDGKERGKRELGDEVEELEAEKEALLDYVEVSHVNRGSTNSGLRFVRRRE